MEKVKGVYGSKEHPELVKEWLKEQGAVDIDGWNCNNSDAVYFVSKRKIVKALDADDCDFLFDIVTLHKPALKVVRGNTYRGKDVIDLLESMGGKNIYNLTGTGDLNYYYIDNKCNNMINNISVGAFSLNDYELEILTLPEKKPKLKVIRGDRKRGKEVITLLESLGGNNVFRFTGTAYSYYYIDEDNIICCVTTESDFLKNYELEIIELPLPKEEPELKVVSGNEQYSDDVIATLKALGGINKYNLRCADKYYYYFVNPSGEIDGLPKDSPFFNTCKLCILEIEKLELKPFDKVLVRDSDDKKWKPSFFSHKIENDIWPFKMIYGGSYKQCIPYKGNEHLLQ